MKTYCNIPTFCCEFFQICERPEFSMIVKPTGAIQAKRFKRTKQYWINDHIFCAKREVFQRSKVLKHPRIRSISIFIMYCKRNKSFRQMTYECSDTWAFILKIIQYKCFKMIQA